METANGGASPFVPLAFPIGSFLAADLAYLVAR
jgi:hypothetical protein